MNRLRALFSLLVLCAIGCGQPHYLKTGRVVGTCEEMCQRYEDCKGDGSKTRACLADCREIFVSNGVPDRASLRDYQQLSCEEAVKFIEGDPPATAQQP